MARGTWEDFNSKWGFTDGGGLEDRDFQARTILVRNLNKALKPHKITVVEFDRGGCHNSCIVVVLPNPDNKKPDELLEAWQSDNDHLQEVNLPDGIDPDEFVAEAYNELDAHHERLEV